MSKKLYVGNISFKLDNEQLREIFAVCGEVKEANIVTDRDTGRSRGFGFVEYEDEDAAMVAVQKINRHEIFGRQLFVSEARERDDNAPRLRPTTLDGDKACIFCGDDHSDVYGFDNQSDVGICNRCLKALNFYARKQNEHA